MAYVARGPDSREDQRGEATVDLRATLGARRELGPDYDHVLADAFVERVDSLVAARVADEVARQHASPRAYPPGVSVRGATAVARPDRYPTSLAYLSVILGIPITSIAGQTTGDWLAVAASWAGIGVVNLAAAWGHHRGGRGQPPAR